MDEKIKTTLLTVFCILIIVASFIGMQYARSLYSQQRIELGDMGFKAPNGFKYVNESFEKMINDSNNETNFYKIVLQNQDKTIELRQYNATLQLIGNDIIDINGISVYKNSTGSNQYYYFNFHGKGYNIIAPIGSDQLIKDIVNSMEAMA
ncbi:MAG: hypothetical protein LBU74_00780 [Methanobacteriaceae archaeon]|jgi:hypothetical protein|nr:hypothetical protein [Candidatus Methanorudis spinitermitis]